ncbi:diphosphomevalonate decarboxylase [Monocercomonoides exilis]|uniref:diphosphomevalonate decarboxylase n=1 Tax=Monocercomonoides exilis TaxID=2049356 RepID=UPI003559A3BF|nr:diphosphomevalonate decarboxylase [Monocercomonoides exilis]|eukprot:MONOS_16854.1-p1 / transcript=MONOS_16854.1 / gene=MONOS_16854 / organism=Monocercomonoides_exilis_PA203 / gene_product=diphosphomevalonate decarboxylase / transcript_product=diphosphomevalonate decarboxylase / location=Mono_scaffold00010:194605-196390(+) / protein_length=436 / sequence_SO=supercontig / SO=protein_coding / is_pseudo=false
MESLTSTTISAPNIAFIKYWGKEDENLIIPMNDSISMTLNRDDFQTTTTVKQKEKGEDANDYFELNGKQAPITDRMKSLLDFFRSLLRTNLRETRQIFFYIKSENSFPTAAGFASSASAYSALVLSLYQYVSHELGIPIPPQLLQAFAESSKPLSDEMLIIPKDKTIQIQSTHLPLLELSMVARRGSGSACRSIYGGFVHWKKSFASDGTSSSSEPSIFDKSHISSGSLQIAECNHWPTLHLFVCETSNVQKKVSSTEGMKKLASFPLWKDKRIKNTSKRIEIAKRAILEKDFATLANVTMEECDEFHQCCEETLSPLNGYLSDTSKKIIQLVKNFNETQKIPKVFYTFDAGPNAFLFVEEQNLLLLAQILFSSSLTHNNSKHTTFVSRDEALKQAVLKIAIQQQSELQIDSENLEIQQITHTTAGSDPLSFVNK